MENKKSLFAQNEEEVLKFWEDKNIFQKTLDKKSPKGNFVFFEGPPTANGKPGIHHVLARSFKDIILRFRTMQGYHIERKAGWDTHGLPVELQVEKALGISGKPDIEKYGIEEFNQKCQESVWQYKTDWENLTRRIGFWLDLQNPYVTYHNDYIETLWWITKELNTKGLLYKGYKVVPQCPRCGTALSSHEVAQGYKSVEDTSIYVKFKLKNQANTYILSWTTTPWTLPGNVALAVGPTIDYAKVKFNNEFYILAKSLVEQVLGPGAEVVEEFKGEKMEGWEYEPLFPGALDPQGKKAWFVGHANFVSTVDGTGVVHTAVMYGEDDFNFGVEYNLPFVHTVDENGKFLPSVTKWAGQFVKKASVEKEIIEDLKSRNLFLEEEKHTHDYPFCWRCDSPLLYYAKDSWFIRVTSVQKELMANNAKINWVPDHIKEGRFGEWLANIKDWAISRQRYWGTPLPIWVCDNCQKVEVIGSLKELEERSGGLPKNKNGEVDVHRPFVDKLTFQCTCGGTMNRVSDVFDCWFDSGAMPFAQYHYPFENKEMIDKKIQYPADFISEAIDQTRGWFYTLLAVATLLGKEAPYKNVICLGHIRDKEGKKMSKSKGNVIDPWMIADKFGIDALRMHLFSINQPGEPKNFDEKDVEEVLRKVVMLLGNVMNFYEMYKVEEDKVELPKLNNVLDKWVMAKLNLLNKEVTEELESYHVFEASRKLIDFINELSTWYVRRSRERLKNEGEDKEACAKVLRFVLLSLVRLLAPFTPFVTERFWGRLQKQVESVHLADWPVLDEKLINWELLKEMEVARKIVELGLAARAEKGMKVRQPLKELQVANLVLKSELTSIIAEEINVKNVVAVKTLEGLNEGWVLKSEGSLSVALDVVLDDTLKAEGLLRELVRTVNQLRKEMSLTIKDKVVMILETEEKDLLEVVEKFKEQLMVQVLAKEINVGAVGDGGKEVEVEKMKLKIKFS
ncbi:MAG: isoleucine--tRNA ligase [Candidatus Magasanikbacteria bacterium]|nr:isoleucine--tRNA ligase [Candidatus Magasanikbacteria bacterium]